MPEKKATALVLVELPRKLNYFVGAKTLPAEPSAWFMITALLSKCP